MSRPYNRRIRTAGNVHRRRWLVRQWWTRFGTHCADRLARWEALKRQLKEPRT